jgi:two-component system chemotaxis response regulator CheB
MSIPDQAASSALADAGPKAGFQVVAIGASAGGLKVLGELLGQLNHDFCCTILIVQHLDPHHVSMMGGLLGRRTKLLVKEAENGEAVSPGCVYLAPPNKHLLIKDGHLQLTATKLVRFSRPSIDTLFESVAQEFGSQSIGVVLSGSNKDGSEGLCMIKQAGGVTIAQAPDSAEFSVMPQAAIDSGCVDRVLNVDEIAHMLNQLCSPQ